MIRRAAALALWAAAALQGGCASWPGAAPAGAAAETPVAATPAAPVQVELEAPAALVPLLEQHLDLIRLSRLAVGLAAADAISDSELDRLAAAAPAQVRALLQTEGYFSPQVTVERLPRVQGQGLRLRLKVDAGPRARIGRIDIDLTGAIARGENRAESHAVETAAALRKRWPLASGAPFRNADWADAKNALLAQLRAAGYANASLAGSTAEVDAEAAPPRVRLLVVPDSGPLYRTGEIEVEGLVVHDRETVLNLAGFGAGRPATEALLLDYHDRLVKAGLFERVAVSIDPDPAQADAAPVRVRLAETPLHSLTLGVGYSANAGARATAEHGWRRVFGRAVTARNKLEWGQARQAWDGEASTHPGERFYRWLAGGTIERLETDTDTVLAQRLRAGRVQDAPRIERFYFLQFDRSSRRTDVTRDDAIALSAHYHWIWRDIDDPLLPTEGWTVSLQGGGGQARETSSSAGPLSRGAFGRGYGRLTGYLPLGGWHAQARLEAGRIFAADGLAVPDGLRFRAGGDDSVRGYPFRSLGPQQNGEVGSGNALLTGSLELARPLSARFPQLWGAAFVDAGDAAARWSDLKPVFGYGLGVRWRSPVGPLKADIAYGHALRRLRLHFSVGIVF